MKSEHLRRYCCGLFIYMTYCNYCCPISAEQIVWFLPSSHYLAGLPATKSMLMRSPVYMIHVTTVYITNQCETLGNIYMGYSLGYLERTIGQN